MSLRPLSCAFGAYETTVTISRHSRVGGPYGWGIAVVGAVIYVTIR
jgi:hypothetical protein